MVGKRNRKAIWEWLCDCGSRAQLTKYVAIRRPVGCGCRPMRRNLGGASNHRGKTRFMYDAWRHMLDRCNPKHAERYPRYAGRGIRVCQEWQDSFQAFVDHIGPRPTKRHSIDRIDNNGHYEPGNVRWATLRVQMQNTRTNRVVECRGKALCTAEWARRLGRSKTNVHYRLARMPVEEALVRLKKVA